jgi:twitching motility two-component system response regulator PilH
MALSDLIKRFKTRTAGSAVPADGSEVPVTLDDLSEPTIPPERRAKSRVDARPGTLALIIDDSATVVAVMRRMLRQNHFETIEALNGPDGIALAINRQPDLIFLDIVMPGMSGFNALRNLRKEPSTIDIPIIMISGNEQATEQFYVQRIGADDFMKKPFSRAELFTRIERLLDENMVPRRITAPKD